MPLLTHGTTATCQYGLPAQVRILSFIFLFFLSYFVLFQTALDDTQTTKDFEEDGIVDCQEIELTPRSQLNNH